MALKKISELDSASTLDGTEDVPLVQNGSTVQTTLATVRLYFKSVFDSIYTKVTDLASTSASKGASLVGVQDTAGNFTGTDVEAVLAELAASGGGGSASFSGANIYRNSSDQVLPTGDHQMMTYDTVAFDEGGWVDLGTDDAFFVVPAGVSYIRVTGQFAFSLDTVGFRRAQLVKSDGTSQFPWDVIVNKAAMAGASTIIQIDSGPQATSPGDLWGFQVFQTSGGNLNMEASGGSTGCWMTVERLG